MTMPITGSAEATYPTPARSVAQMLVDRVAATPRREALRFPTDRGWEALSWEQVGQQAYDLAAGLLALGLGSEERVAVICSTRFEWILADLAVMCAGGATTSVYPSTEPSDVAFIVSDSGSRFVFAEDAEQLAKLRDARDQLPDVVRVIVIDGEGDGDWVMSWRDLARLGADHLRDNPGSVDAVIATITPGQLATLIYTSGTTGRPKGVELSQSCWTYEGACIDAVEILSIDDVQFLWLPLSHSFGKVLLAAMLQIGFPTAVDGRVDKIADGLAEVKPTFMAGAPRIFEKVRARVIQTALGEGGAKLIQRADQGEIDRIARQAVAGDRVAGHMLALKNLQPHAHRVRQDDIGGHSICRGERQDGRQLLVHPVEDVDDQPDGEHAEPEDRQALEGADEKSHGRQSIRCRPRGLEKLVTPAGFEPATLRLGSRQSEGHRAARCAADFGVHPGE